MTQIIPINVGETFSEPMLVLLPAGTGVWSASSQMRRPDDTLIAALTCSLNALSLPDASGNTHSGLLFADSDVTAAWPLGSWYCDVKFYDEATPPQVKYMEPFVVRVSRAKTHG